MAINQSSPLKKWFFFLLVLSLTCTSGYGDGQSASTAESKAESSQITTEPIVPPAPVPVIAPPVVEAPVVLAAPPVVAGPAVGASSATSSAAAAPASSVPVPIAPIVTPPIVPVGPIISPPVAVVSGPIQPGINGIGTTTHHQTPDGSFHSTVTTFNGQIPADSLHQHFPQMPMLNPWSVHPNLYYGSPLFPAWANTHGHGAIAGAAARSIRSTQEDSKKPLKKDASHPALKKPPRVSTKFHYPAPPNEYFTTYKRPAVPVIDNEFSDLM